MNEENVVMFIASIICLCAILFTGGSKRFKLLNLVVFAAYSIPLWWALLFNGAFGAGFTWLFYLATLTIAQLLFVLIYQGIKKIKSKLNK